VNVDFRGAAKNVKAAIEWPRDEFRADIIRDKRSVAIGEHHRKRVVWVIVGGSKITALTSGF
jgi:hypothetical protein